MKNSSFSRFISYTPPSIKPTSRRAQGACWVCSYSVYPPGGNSVTSGEGNEVHVVKVELNMLERVHWKFSILSRVSLYIITLHTLLPALALSQWSCSINWTSLIQLLILMRLHYLRGFSAEEFRIHRQRAYCRTWKPHLTASICPASAPS